ncbi:MAG: phytanoyl-CoA dioxygenase family protein [Bacteroidia bacterium]
MHYKYNLEENGITLIPNIINHSLCANAIAVIEEYIRLNKSEDLLITDKGIPRKLCYAFDKGEVFLLIISEPKLIQILKNIYTNLDEIVPTWEDILIKSAKNGIPVELHQDLGLQTVSYGDVLSLAIYLNDANKNPVYYLEKSHKLGALTRTQLKQYQDKTLYTPIFAHKGDLTIHNILTLHFSNNNISKLPRYTWYVEFRSIPQIINDSPWNEDWARKRQSILQYAIQLRKKYGLPYEELYSQSYAEECLEKKPTLFKVPHLTNDITYNDNEYNHFINHTTLF